MTQERELYRRRMRRRILEFLDEHPEMVMCGQSPSQQNFTLILSVLCMLPEGLGSREASL